MKIVQTMKFPLLKIGKSSKAIYRPGQALGFPDFRTFGTRRW